MRIVHYHTSIRLEHGGVVKAVLDLTGSLAAAGEVVVLAGPDLQDVPEAWRAGGDGLPELAPTPPTDRPLGRFSAAALEAHRSLIAGADVVHFHGMWAPRVPQLATLSREVGTPYVISPHGMLDEWCMAQKSLKKRLFLGLTGRRWLDGAAAILCTAEAELEQSCRWFDRRRGAVLPLIMDLEPFRELPPAELAHRRIPEIDPQRPTCLFLSRLHHKKGVELLIDAAAALLGEGRPLQVVIGGTGEPAYEQSLRDRAARAGLGEHAIFPGFVSGPEKIALYAAADVFVLPTSQENFGFVIFEALAAGTPVVTTRGADTWPEVEGSGGGVIAEATPTAIAAAISRLLDDPAERTAMGERARAWALESLSTGPVVERYRAFYREVAEGTFVA